MQIHRINSANIYAANAVSMKAKTTNQTVLKDFNKLLKLNDVIINAKLSPNGNGKYKTSIELAKEDPYRYGTVPVTDEEGYAITGFGENINDAIINLLKTYKNKDVYCSKNGGIPVLTMPDYKV